MTFSCPDLILLVSGIGLVSNITDCNIKIRVGAVTYNCKLRESIVVSLQVHERLGMRVAPRVHLMSVTAILPQSAAERKCGTASRDRLKSFDLEVGRS